MDPLPCASLVGPREVQLSVARLQQGLERRFPVKHRILAVVDVELTRPQLALLPDERIGLRLEASVSAPFVKPTWRASFALSGRLILDGEGRAILMSDARVERLELDGADPARQRQLTEVANFVADRVVRDMPLYHFQPEDLRFAGVQFVPARITTTANALTVTLEPAR